MRVEMFTFLVAGAICLGGALGVVLFRNPVHNALSLVATLFGVAVLFIAQEAYFLAAIQVIVYAGAIVVLFLFVIMLLGVDRTERIGLEPIRGQRVGAVVAGVSVLGLSLVALLSVGQRATGVPGGPANVDPTAPNVDQIGQALFTDWVFAFEATAVLLTIAVVGAVVLARRVTSAPIDLEEFPEGTAADHLEARADLLGLDLDHDGTPDHAPGPGDAGTSGDPVASESPAAAAEDAAASETGGEGR